jgi:hypothetical protein
VDRPSATSPVPVGWAARFGRSTDHLFDGCVNIGIATAIYPVEPRKEPTLSYRLLRAVYPAFRVLPNQVVRADDLARVMIDAAVRGTSEPPDSILVLSIRSPFRVAVNGLEGPGEGVGDEGDQLV